MDVGFIGAGGIASTHMEHLDAIDGVGVAAVADVDEETATDRARERDAAPYTDHEEMLAEHPDLDAVYVAVPPFAHDGQEAAVAERGIDLFVEKPLGLDADYAETVQSALDDADVLCQVGYMNRYHPLVERADELVAGRQVALVNGYWYSGVPGGWWNRRDRSGGQVVEQSTHVFDLVRSFAGEPVRVTAEGDRTVNDEELDFEDATAAVVRHETGATSQVASTSTAPDATIGLDLAGDGFSLRLDLTDGTLSGVVNGTEIREESDADPYRLEDEAFVEAVRTGDPDNLRSPYADARRTFELTLAVEDSLASGDPVDC